MTPSHVAETNPNCLLNYLICPLCTGRNNHNCSDQRQSASEKCLLTNSKASLNSVQMLQMIFRFHIQSYTLHRVTLLISCAF